MLSTCTDRRCDAPQWAISASFSFTAAWDCSIDNRVLGGSHVWSFSRQVRRVAKWAAVESSSAVPAYRLYEANQRTDQGNSTT